MSSLGIYFGPKTIAIVDTSAKKVINSVLIPQSTVVVDELEEKVPLEIKSAGINSLIKDELLKNRILSKEATLCLSGKDIIIRTIEMPMMSREELYSAINFEVKKYIPFKVEDLISNFQITLDKQNHSNLVLFIGIKKETLDKYISMLSELNIKINAIEYSAYSILRCLKLVNASEKGITGLLAVDIDGKDEVNFTVLENGFPLFSRDIALTSEAQDLGGSEEKTSEEIFEKLKSELRVSLDYYHRKFSTKDAKKIFLLCDQKYRLNLEAIIKEIGLGVQFIDVTRRIDKPVSYSLSFIKGYSASLSKTIKSNIRINLLAAKEKAKAPKEIGFEKAPENLFKDLKLDFRFVVIGALLCIGVYLFGIYRMQPLRKDLQNIIAERRQVISAGPMASVEELSGIESNYNSRLDAIDKLIKYHLYLTEPLSAIPGAIPKGAWLTDFSYNGRQEGHSSFQFNGIVCLGESDKEFAAVNKIISNLKESPGFGKYFKDIHIISMDRRQLGNLTVTYFSISCSAD